MNLISKPYILTLLLFGCSSLAFSEVKSKIITDKPVFDNMKSPESSENKSKPFTPKNWLAVEAKIKVLLSPAPPSETAESINVKWYIAVKNPEKSGTYLLLTKSINYVNIPLDEEVYVSAYISPASIRRITGKNSSTPKESVELAGYEVYFNGEKVASETNKGSKEWWNIPSEKISVSNTIPLLQKDETPFSMMWWDRYAEISKEKN